MMARDTTQTNGQQNEAPSEVLSNEDVVETRLKQNVGAIVERLHRGEEVASVVEQITHAAHAAVLAQRLEAEAQTPEMEAIAGALNDLAVRLHAHAETLHEKESVTQLEDMRQKKEAEKQAQEQALQPLRQVTEGAKKLFTAYVINGVENDPSLQSFAARVGAIAEQVRTALGDANTQQVLASRMEQAGDITSALSSLDNALAVCLSNGRGRAQGGPGTFDAAPQTVAQAEQVRAQVAGILDLFAEFESAAKAAA